MRIPKAMQQPFDTTVPIPSINVSAVAAKVEAKLSCSGLLADKLPHPDFTVRRSLFYPFHFFVREAFEEDTLTEEIARDILVNVPKDTKILKDSVHVNLATAGFPDIYNHPQYCRPYDPRKLKPNEFPGVYVTAETGLMM